MPRLIPTSLLATTLAATLLAGAAHASPRDSVHAGDRYGYGQRIDSRDVYTDGARSGRFDPFSEGARDVSPATSRDRDSDRSLSGLDRRGVSAEPSRQFDVYTDGALA
ncbi:hypothetical protein [Cupriavidus agavae]|uniref:Hydroxyquinol 1,2-dioxygenase n=1 Tax=Cupriavidus agavae TaxID=1001822 RepID=A0A4Q7R9L5_9BURK|nr:hypothetical protein [Cupriavidus agavae]RZT29037.1 hypothetical protein EV147_5134 [Cupriavidus agavae]